MQAVILAAGDGERLHPQTALMPKPLLQLDGRPLINHVLDTLCEAGIDDAVVVVGHFGDQVRRALADRHPCGVRIRFAENDAPLLGNARSIWSARHAVDGPFLLTMADHLVEPGLIRALLAGAPDRCRLAVDFAQPGDPRASEATLALVHEGHIDALGKQLTEWNALDTGVFWCTPEVFTALTPDLRDGEGGAMFSSLARAGALDAVDVTGMAWQDIDTAQDLLDANSRLSEFTAWRRDVVVA